MTIHSAKGLEFKNVFVVGLEENLFPSPMVTEHPRQLEEERRLFYVAITRAEEHCFLSYAKSRFKYGKTEFSSPSRFLHDIDARYLKLPEGEAVFSRSNIQQRTDRLTMETPPTLRPKVSAEKPRIVSVASPRNLRKVSSISSEVKDPGTATDAGITIGQLIEHQRFVIGKVVNVEGTGDNCKATVEFQNAGTKQLLLKFARFKIIK